MEFSDRKAIKSMDGVVFAAAHKEFENLKMDDIDGLFGDGKGVLLDIKGLIYKENN